MRNIVVESEDSTDYDGLLARVDKRVRAQGKRGKAAWSRLEEVLADRKLEKDLRESSTTKTSEGSAARGERSRLSGTQPLSPTG